MAIDDIKRKWASAKPATKQKIVISAVIGGLAVGGALLNMGGEEKKKPVKLSTAEATKTVSLDSKILEKTMAAQADKQREEINAMKKKMEAMEKGQLMAGAPAGTSTGEAPVDAGTALLSPVKKTVSAEKPKASFPSAPPVPVAAPKNPVGKQLPPPPPVPTNTSYAPIPSPQVVPPAPIVEVVGDIEIASNSSKSVVPATVDNKKKAKRSVYLPPSFMAATLISGLNAPTSDGARGNPVPVLIRIKDLAVLPNQVKSDLKGCFVIAEGVGNLADERAHLRLISLSCLSRGGEAVIDAKIKGFAVDADGKLGLSGNVVSKMGAVLARTLVAGFFGGVGDALKQANSQTSTTALGQTTVQNLDPTTVAIAGLGSGISNSAKELQRFYLDLAKQTMPVVEVGAAKKITLVIQEGVDLEIKNVKTVPR